jgi:PAS domain S-box-containing protein
MPLSPLDPAAHDEPASLRGEEHRMLATLLENLPGMVYRCRNDADWTMEFVSDGCRALCGYTPADLLENHRISFGQLIHPDDRTMVWDSVQDAIAHRQPFELTYRIVDAEDRERWVWERGRGVFDAHGKLLALEGFITDITERKHAEVALGEKERTLRALLDQSTQFAGMLDIDGRLLIANRTALVTIGVTFDDVRGRLFWETRWWNHSPTEQERLKDAIVRARHGETVRFETVHQRANGREIQIDFSLKPIRGYDDEVVGFIAEGRDITDRKEAERALRESEGKFSRAFRACPDSVSITELGTGLLLEVNDGFERCFGYTRDEVIGRTSIELGLWAEAEDRKHLVDLLTTMGSVRDFRGTGRRRGGELRDMLISAEVVEIGGRLCSVLVVRDIHEMNRAAEAQARLEAQLLQAQKLEALGTLSGGIAHDFNNILTAIYSFADLSMRNLENPERVRRYLTELRRASDRAADLVRQILAFSRQQKQERRPTQMQGVVREVLKLLRATLPATVEIEATIDDDVPKILADAGQLHQVLMNLCTNAAHAMKGAPGCLTITLQPTFITDDDTRSIPELHTGRHAHLIVADTGLGMSAETIERIYEPFFTTKAPGEGTGLGLPVVHGIVRAHDGAIRVTSALGEGSRFELFFPENTSVEETSPKAVPPMPPGRNEHILFVDDEQAICDAARGILEDSGYRVTTQTDPEAALTFFLDHPDQIHLVLTDLTMPRLTGLDLAQRIHARFPSFPVILLSGYSASWTPQRVRDLGVIDLITKPFSLDRLLNAVRVALDEHRPSHG